MQFSEQFNSDIRATMDWREPFDIPDYLDQNGDNILDEFQDLDQAGILRQVQVPDSALLRSL